MNSRIRCAVVRKTTQMMVLLPLMLILASTGNKVSAATDTTWSASFQVNMSKAVRDNIFHPDSDFVYVILDQGILPMKLVPGPGYNYSGTLYNELDSSLTYHFKFRINDSVWEAVNRTLTPVPGNANVSVWWNDDPLNITTFAVNMEYAIQQGLFNPASDSVTVTGTMNSWLGSPKMNRAGATPVYTYDYTLDPGAVHQYKYRINTGDTVSQQLELINLPNRMLRVPDTLLTAASDFNNYNPGKRLMTFNCDMSYYISSLRFDPYADYVDVAGNFNGGGGNDVLFDTDGDSVYSLGKYLDTSYIHQAPLAFKFRINGNWATAELQDKPDRNYAFHDTVGQNPNIFTCYYNNVDPTVPTPPWAYDVAITGKLIHKQILSGIYSYEDINGIPEDSTSYRWLRSFDAAGDSVIAIDSAWKITYKIDTVDVGKWLIFEVTPRAAYGDSAVGRPVQVISATSVGGVGIAEFSPLITRIYPNPASDYITVEAIKEIDRVEILTLAGQTVMTAGNLRSQAVRFQVGQLPRGNYLLKATTKSHEWGVVQVVKE